MAATVGAAQADGTADATVTWRATSPRPDHYVVRASVTGVAPVQVPGTTTTATVRSLVCGTDVTFTVEAVVDDAGATSPASSAVRTPVCPPTAPAAATGVSAVAHADGSVTVSWNASTTAVDSYLVGPEGGSTTTAGATATSIVLRDLAPGSTVRFVVQAVRAGLSTPSAPSGAVTVAAPPGAVASLALRGEARSGDVLSFSLGWAAAAANGSPVTGYVVTWSGGGVSGSTTTTATAADLSVSCAGQPLCTSGGTVTLNVTARNGVGDGPGASVAASVAPPPPPPPANGDVVVTSLQWQTPGQYDEMIPMTAHLSMPESWTAAGGTCTIQISAGGISDSGGIACASASLHVGSYRGGTTVSVSVRAPNGAVSNTASEDVPPRNSWAYCDPNTRICTDPVSLAPDPEVVVVPLPWTPSLPGGPERPPLLATGVGLLLAAGALRALRLRRPDDATARTTARPTAARPTTEELPA